MIDDDITAIAYKLLLLITLHIAKNWQAENIWHVPKY